MPEKESFQLPVFQTFFNGFSEIYMEASG